MEFKDRLRQLRIEKELTQEGFGKQFNVIKQTVSSWENGNSKPDIAMAAQMADFFDVSSDYLLGLSNERRPGDGVQAIDDPEVQEFAQRINAHFRANPEMTPKERREVMEDAYDVLRVIFNRRKRDGKE